MNDIDDFEEGEAGGEAAAAQTDIGASEFLLGEPCLSCGVPSPGVFCVNCGQKQDDLRRSLLLLGRQFVEDTFSFDGRMWRTLGSLAAAPGVVPTHYSHGKRSKYTPPVRLFLVVSFLFFLTVAATNTLFVGLEVNFKDPETAAPAPPITPDDVVVAQKTDSAIGENCSFSGNLRFLIKERNLKTDRERLEACIGGASDLVKNKLESDDVQIQIGDDEGREKEVEQGQEVVDRVFGGINWAVTNPREFNDAVNDWLPRVMFFMTPVLALILTLFLRREVFIFDHMVFSLYIHAVNFAIVGATLILGQFGVPLVGFLAVIGVAMYYFIALKRAYKRGWIKTIWTTFASASLYSLIFIVILMSIVSKIVWQAVG
ncbi:MAG: DUF3667 domain-containing protein [Marinicaulis sp.]|nr:DUF3667 domain-containing protein [Marinicaulis sp.]